MNAFLDVRAISSCVQQIARTKKMLQTLNAGDTLTVRFLDEITLVDFKSLCQLMHHTLLDVYAGEGFYEIKILL